MIMSFRLRSRETENHLKPIEGNSITRAIYIVISILNGSFKHEDENIFPIKVYIDLYYGIYMYKLRKSRVGQEA
jgi:hypothetical protein